MAWKSGTTRRLTGLLAAGALALGLMACDVSFEGEHSMVSITRTCLGEPDHAGTAPYRTQVLVTIDPEQTGTYTAIISLNRGEESSYKTNMNPGDGLALVDGTTNTDEVDVAVIPEDDTRDPDIFNQTFNPC